jgi:prophage regulatory protein
MSEEIKSKGIMRRREVMAWSGYGNTALYEHIRLGEFPAPVKLTDSGCAVGWLVEELEAWRESRIALRDKKRESA